MVAPQKKVHFYTTVKPAVFVCISTIVKLAIFVCIFTIVKPDIFLCISTIMKSFICAFRRAKLLSLFLLLFLFLINEAFPTHVARW